MSEFVRVPEGATAWRMDVTSQDATLERVAAYLPSNFRCHETISLIGETGLVITGVDVSGWTVTYVRERLMSGLIATADPVTERIVGEVEA